MVTANKVRCVDCRSGLVIPASYLFEVKEIDRFLRELALVRANGLLHFASSTSNLSTYALEKRSEYRDELPLFPRYEDQGINRPEDQRLVWIPRIKRSTSVDIGTAWHDELHHQTGLWNQLLESKDARQMRLPSMLEKTIDAVPAELEGRAFIYRFVEPLLPFHPNAMAESKIKLLVSREYLKSYLFELDAAILTETPLGDLDCGIEQTSPTGGLWAVSWRSIASCFDTLGIRGFVESLSWRDLLRLRSQPILRWVIELAFNHNIEGSSVFQDVATLSGFRSPASAKPSKARLLDVIRDRIWQFHAVIQPVVYRYDWTDLVIGAMRLPSQRGREVKRTQARHITQMPSLPEACDVGIIVALDEEFRELSRELGRQLKPYRDEESEQYFYLFNYPSRDGSSPYSCVATFVGEMGPTAAALFTEKLRTRWRVKTIVNVGIAAGLDTDVKLGDVIAVSLADGYLERSKATRTADGSGFCFELSGEPFRPSHQLLESCGNFEFAHFAHHAAWQQICIRRLKTLLPKTN